MKLSPEASFLFEKIMVRITTTLVEVVASGKSGAYALHLSDLLGELMEDPKVTTEERVIVALKVGMALPDVVANVAKRFGAQHEVITDQIVNND